jgi:thiol:disulfide interchange protein DsbC
VRHHCYLWMLGLLLAGAGYAQEEDQVLRVLHDRIPETAIKEVHKLPGVDLFEVVAADGSVFYVDRLAQFAAVGEVFDLRSRTNLTQMRRVEQLRTDFSKLPLQRAIVRKKGSGARKVAVFSDPDCPYCQQLEKELAGVTDVTVYLYLMPLVQLHPDASRRANLVWCAADPANAWEAMVLSMTAVPAGENTGCSAPLVEIASLAASLGIEGTPGLVFESGRIVPGFAPRDKLEEYLNEHRPGS